MDLSSLGAFHLKTLERREQPPRPHQHHRPHQQPQQLPIREPAAVPGPTHSSLPPSQSPRVPHQQRTSVPQERSQKRQKVEVDPSTLPFFCAPCHKGYRSSEMYELHVDEHEPCVASGCHFSACAAVMKDHMLVHNPVVQGWMNMTDEEVAKWREDRKRNWPTAENIARKAAEQELDKEERKHQRPAPRSREIKFQMPKASLLGALFESEKRIETDLLIQCFEYMKSIALAQE
jgi:hypothetical protein